MEAGVDDLEGPGRLADQLRSLRTSAGLSQEELAERAHLSSDAVSALERGTRRHPYPATVRALAKALSLSREQEAVLIAAVPNRPRSGARRTPRLDPARTLPVPAGSLFGRERDLADVSALLGRGQSRLVTLIGPGGVGKTRLALEVARSWDPPHGAHFVPLAGLHDPGLVIPEVARALGVSPASPADVSAALADTNVLVVLDNLEHVIDATLPLSDLLAGAPGASVLVTSRTALRIRGEVEYQVHPLPLPEPGCEDAAALLASPAAALLVSRGRAIRRDLVLTPSQASAISEICHRLAGLPLALELAAAGLRTFEPVGLLAHLDEVMLAPGPPDLPHRQHTLRATLQWSYELLTRAQAEAFRRLSVFVDGFTWDAASCVLPAHDAHQLLQDLAAHSLCHVVVSEDGELRYQMLSLVAEFGRDKWSGDEAHAVSAAHCSYFLRLADQALVGTHGSQQKQSLELLDREASNLSSAFEWAITRGEGELAGRFIWALWMYWWMRGRAPWARQLTATALTLPMSDTTRGRALIAFGGIADPAEDRSAAERCYAAAAQLAEKCGDRDAQASAALALGTIALERQDYHAAEEQLAEVVSTEGSAPNDAWYSGHALVLLGVAQRFRGDLRRAVQSVTAGLEHARARDDAVATTIALYNLGQTYAALDKPHLARSHLLEAANICVEDRDTIDLASVLTALASITDVDPIHAAGLFGSATTLRSESVGAGYAFYAPDDVRASRVQDQLRAALGEAVYGAAYEAGTQLSVTQAVELARSHRSLPLGHATRSTTPGFPPI